MSPICRQIKIFIIKISTINTNNIDISKTETRVNTSNTDNIYSSINISKTRTCGSGKKYKHCCLLKESMSTGDLIRAAVQNAGYKEDIANVLCNLSEYMKRKQWWGACHASCSALYVALSELGYSPKLCIGEMLGQGLYFDHSWIELDGQILDIAISMTLLGGAPVSEPIVFGKNIRSGKEPVIKYGVPGRGIEGETLVVNSLPFIDYMDGFPDEKNGLWGVVQELLGRKVDILDLREKYKNVERVIVRE